jgi:hypothetical protein
MPCPSFPYPALYFKRTLFVCELGQYMIAYFPYLTV